MKKQKNKSKKSKKKIILPTPKNLATALFMHSLPEILNIWERECNKEIPFDIWLMQIYVNHSEAAAETSDDIILDDNVNERRNL